jgi:hypothetical protein
MTRVLAGALMILGVGCSSDFHARMVVTEPMPIEVELGDDRPGLIYGGIESIEGVPRALFVMAYDTKSADGSSSNGGPTTVSAVQVGFSVARVGEIVPPHGNGLDVMFRDLRMGLGTRFSEATIDWTVPSLVLVHGMRDGKKIEASIEGPLVEKLYNMRLATQD